MSTSKTKIASPDDNKSARKIHIHRGLSSWWMKYLFYPATFLISIAIVVLYGFFVYQLDDLEKKPSITCVTGTCNHAVSNPTSNNLGRSGNYRAQTD